MTYLEYQYPKRMHCHSLFESSLSQVAGCCKHPKVPCKMDPSSISSIFGLINTAAALGEYFEFNGTRTGIQDSSPSSTTRTHPTAPEYPERGNKSVQEWLNWEQIKTYYSDKRVEKGAEAGVLV
ncbi:hypothetical protein PspLS_08680 [Pyricularia sp. CBS 133598]|nr:hypothetical protein PspLS_08680 [Pyricularia sp. CBS 133598]